LITTNNNRAGLLHSLEISIKGKDVSSQFNVVWLGLVQVVEGLVDVSEEGNADAFIEIFSIGNVELIIEAGKEKGQWVGIAKSEVSGRSENGKEGNDEDLDHS